MKFLIFSDIHGSSLYTDLILDIYNKFECDYIILLGDILYHGPRNPLPLGHDPQSVVKKLNEYASKIICVAGNCESQVDQMVLDFPCLSDYTIIMDNGITIFATHGHIYNPDKLPKFEAIDLFLYGHTHLYEIRQHGHMTICNPGSISLPKEGRPNSYAIFDNGELTIYNLEGKILATHNMRKDSTT